MSKQPGPLFGLFVFEYSNTEKDRESGINGGKGGTGVKAPDEYITAISKNAYSAKNI